jgi:hypothetical protein
MRSAFWRNKSRQFIVSGGLRDQANFYSYLVSIGGAHRKIVSCMSAWCNAHAIEQAQVQSKYWRRKQTPVAPPGSRSFKSPSGILSVWENIRTLIRFQSGA